MKLLQRVKKNDASLVYISIYATIHTKRQPSANVKSNVGFPKQVSDRHNDRASAYVVHCIYIRLEVTSMNKIVLENTSLCNVTAQILCSAHLLKQKDPIHVHITLNYCRSIQ